MAFNSTLAERSRCSYHGDYNSVSGCICDNGWTGLGDLSIVAGVHCDINSAAVAYLSYSVLCINALCAIHLIVRVLENRRLRFNSLDPRTIFPLFFLAHMLDGIYYSVNKIAYNGQQIVGRDLNITISGCLMPVLGQAGLALYFLVVVKFLKSFIPIMPVARRDRVVNRFALLIRIMCIVPLLSIVFAVMPGIGLAYQRSWKIFGRIYLIGNGVNAGLYGTLLAVALRLVLFELRSHVKLFPHNSEDMRGVIRRLNSAYWVIVTNAFALMLVAILFGAYDYLMGRAILMFMYVELTCPIAGTILVLTVSKKPVQQTQEEIEVVTNEIYSVIKRKLSATLMMPFFPSTRQALKIVPANSSDCDENGSELGTLP